MVKTNIVLSAKMRREVRYSWKQFLAIIFIAGLAITLYVGFSANAQVFAHQVNQLYQDGNMADIWTTVTEYKPSDEASLRVLDGVSAFESRMVLAANVNGKSANALITDGNPVINKEASIDEGEPGFMLDTNFAKTYHIAVGDIVDTAFIVPSTSLFTNANFSFTVTGLMTHPENIQNGSYSDCYFLVTKTIFYAAFEVMVNNTYAEPEASNIIDVFEHGVILKNQYLIQVEDDYPVETVVSDILTYFNTYASHRLVMCLDIANLPSNNVAQNDIVQAQELTLVFPTLFFLVAVLVILTTLSQIILKERTQIGTMKAIGLRKREIIFHYMSLAIVLCLIGTALGFIAGPFLIPAIMSRKYALLYSLPAMVYTFPVWAAIGCAMFLLGLASLVCYLVARQEVRLTPAGSMRAATPKAQKEILFEKIVKKNDGDMSLKMALRNIRINYAKSLMVIVGVMGCTSLLVCGFGIDDTLDHGIEVDMTEIYASDMIARYYADSPSLKTELEAVDGVKTVEEFSLFPATISLDKTISGKIYLVNEDTAFYQVPLDPNTLVLSKKVANDIGAKVGDQITFTVLGTNYVETVGLIHETFFTHGIFAASSLFPSLSATPTHAWINRDEGVTTDAVKVSVLSSVSGVSAIITHDEQAQRINDMLSSIHLMTLNIKIFAVLLAVVVLYNLAMLNFKERYRDIATLRVLGFTRNEIAKSLVIEIMLLTVVGVFFGLFLGLPTEILVLITNETPMVAFLYLIRPISYLWSILITFGAAFAINLFLSSLTDRVPMVESLKSIE